MSVACMTWAFGLPLKPAAKMVLLAIADVVDDGGAGWVEIARLEVKSSQSRATVQRRLKRLEDIGLLARLQRFAADGRRLADEFRLALGITAQDLLRRPKDDADIIHGIDDEGADEASHEAETDDPPSQIDTPPGASDCDGEGITHVRRGGPQQVTPPKETKHNQTEDSPPNPPPGGVRSDGLSREGRELFEGFRADYPETSRWVWLKVEPLFAALSAAEQRHVRAAAAPYARLFGDRRKGLPLRPERFIREKVFENFPAQAAVAGGGGPYHAEGSESAKAIGALYAVAGKSQYFRDVVKRPGAPLYFAKPVDARLAALANAPPLDAWPIVDHRQAAAWEEFLRAYLTVNRNRFVEGARAPWPWPPSIDGKVYPHETGPPSAPEMSDDDADALAKEGMR